MAYVTPLLLPSFCSSLICFCFRKKGKQGSLQEKNWPEDLYWTPYLPALDVLVPSFWKLNEWFSTSTIVILSSPPPLTTNDTVRADQLLLHCKCCFINKKPPHHSSWECEYELDLHFCWPGSHIVSMVDMRHTLVPLKIAELYFSNNVEHMFWGCGARLGQWVCIICPSIV